MKLRKAVLLLSLMVTVLAPILLYTYTGFTFTPRDEFVEEVSVFTLRGEIRPLNVLPQLLILFYCLLNTQYQIRKHKQLPLPSCNAKHGLNIESIASLCISIISVFFICGCFNPNGISQDTNEPLGVVYSKSSILSHSRTLHSRSENSSKTRRLTEELLESRRNVQETEKADIDDPIRQATEQGLNTHKGGEKSVKVASAVEVKSTDKISAVETDHKSRNSSTTVDKVHGQETLQKFSTNHMSSKNVKQNEQKVFTDARIHQLRDQLIRARVYLSLSAATSNPHFVRELRLRMKELERALGEATIDSELPRNANVRMKAMEQTLAKAKQNHDDCVTFIKKLRAMLHSTEEQIQAQTKQAMFLTHLTAKTLPKGFHCLPLSLSTEYFKLNSSQRHFPNEEKLENPKLYHYVIFSDNILATAVVVNSTVSHAKDPSEHVFHIVTDRLNFASMRMWFLINSPQNATIEVQNVEDFTWLNSTYNPVLKQMGTPSMINYYFKDHNADTDSNMKYRNPKYLSIMNHLRFYIPEIFPKLNKVLFLDDDIVVQKDLTALWFLNMKGKVVGVVEMCGESFHRFDRYLNFSNPLISQKFDPRACGWAFGMNIFDLSEWKRRNITEVYHSWQTLNNNRQLWMLGTLPPGLITFWNHTYALDRSWHILGLGYNPNVSLKDIERAAVIHYNGNLKPWLEISIPKFRNYWSRFIDYDHEFLRECNINSLGSN